MKKLTGLLIICQLCAISTLYADYKSDSLKARNLEDRGFAIQQKAQYEESIVLFDSALSLYQKINDMPSYFHNVTNKGWSYYFMGKFDQGIEVCEEALKLCEEVGTAKSKIKLLRMVGIGFSNKSDHDKAIEYFTYCVDERAALHGIDHPDYGTSISDLAVAYQRQGNLKKSLELHQNANKIFTQFGDSLTKSLKNNYLNIGALHHALGDYHGLLDNSKKALKYSIKYHGQKHVSTANVYENIGVGYTGLGQYLLALDYYEQSLNIRLELLGPNHYKVGNNHANMSSCYAKMGMYEEATPHYYISYNIRKATLGDDHTRTIEGLDNLGLNFLNLNQLDSAEKYLDLALEAEIKKYGQAHISIGNTYDKLAILEARRNNFELSEKYYLKAIEVFEQIEGSLLFLPSTLTNLAKLHKMQGRYQEAINSLNRSLTLNNVKLSHDSLAPPVVSSNYFNFNFAYKALTEKRSVIYEMNKDNDTIQAITNFQYIDSLTTFFGKHRTGIENQEDLFRWIDSYHYHLGEAVWSCDNLFDLTGDSTYLNKAMAFNLTAKGNLLLDRLSHLHARQYAGIPDSLIQYEKELVKNIESHKSKYQYIEDNVADDAIQAQLNLEQEYNDLIRKIELNYPAYYRLKYNNIQPAIGDIQEYLTKNNGNAIVYLIHQDLLFASLFTEKGNFLYRIPFPDSVKSMVHQFRIAIGDSENEQYQDLSKGLSKVLLDTLINDISQKNLVIIGDGILNNIPFELLADPMDQDKLLFENYNLRYVNSLPLLIRTPDRPINDQLISFAPDFASTDNQQLASLDVVRSELGNIPGALQEVDELKQIFNGSAWVKNLATETNFKERVGDFGLIHMATHAIVDDANPDNSRLVFDLANDSLSDGYLYAHEIYNLELRAQLVTLSACNTGFGEIRNGEGVMSLSRAFAYAGVPASVVSLWPASDKSTPELMKYFYQNLANGESKDIALNNARKQYLATATGKAKHPFYWGGFVLIGDHTPIQDGSSNVAIILSILFLMTALPIVVVIKQKYLKLDD